jgi:hypothetical protein
MGSGGRTAPAAGLISQVHSGVKSGSGLVQGATPAEDDCTLPSVSSVNAHEGCNQLNPGRVASVPYPAVMCSSLTTTSSYNRNRACLAAIAPLRCPFEGQYAERDSSVFASNR